MGRPDRIYFVEAARGPHGGPYFDLDEALFAGLALASAAGRAVRVVGVPVDFCETIEPPTDMPASVSEVRRVRELAAERAWVRPCGAMDMGYQCGRDRGHEGEHVSSPGGVHRWPQAERCPATTRIDGVGAGQCKLGQLHVQEHRADIGGRTWRWPVGR